MEVDSALDPISSQWVIDWADLDKLLYGDSANKKKLQELSHDYKLSMAVELEDGLPDLSTAIIPHCALDGSDLAIYGMKKRRGLKRKASRAQQEDDEGDDDFDDYHFCVYKYQQFYKCIEEQRKTWKYVSSMKKHSDNNPAHLVQELDILNLPRVSVFSAGKQKMFLRLVRKFADGDCGNRQKYELFINMTKVVQKEQKDYLSFCLRQAKYSKPIDYEYVLPGLINYIERTLFQRQHSVPQSYAALYHLHSVMNMHITQQQEQISFKADSFIDALGYCPYTDTSNEFYKGLVLEDMVEDLEFLIPSDDKLSYLVEEEEEDDGPFIYKTPISLDENAAKFASEFDADIVTSSGVMQRLMDIHPYSLQNSATRRDIPIVVKMITMPDGSEKRVVFMDKALPPLEMTLHDKKMWACKRAVRAMFASYDIKTLRFLDMEEVDAQKKGEPVETNVPFKDDKDARSTTAKCTVESLEEEEGSLIMPPSNHNVTYGRYTIGSTDRRINLVVRSSYHAYEMKTEGGKPNYLHFSVKLEQQPEYGAQATTISEISREWMALSLRKGATLCRVRVDANTLEVIQVEKKKIKSLDHECKKRGMNVKARIASLHHVFNKLTKLSAGSYILQLIPIEGVARLLEHDTTDTTLRGGSYFNLHLHYRRANHLIGPLSRVPYSFIDPTVFTPYHIVNDRIPATFNPMVKKEIKVVKVEQGGDSQLLFGLPSNEHEGAVGDTDPLAEEGEEFSLQVSEDESVDEWLVEDEIKESANVLQKLMEDDPKEIEKVQPKIMGPPPVVKEKETLAEFMLEKNQLVQEKAVTEDGDESFYGEDFRSAMLEMQVLSPISMIARSDMTDVQN